MVKLKWKTKGDFSPQGKPKVFLCCHPEDYNLYVNEICNDIWKTHDCAVYYFEEADAAVSIEEVDACLEEMQLFVVPVTGRFLLSPNRGRDIELSFAKNHLRPILPLMMESGFVEPFGEVFGQLQFLNKYTQDVTEVPYEEKLKKFLEAVLIGDELAKKVRAAFDAYIFLSYRKKDRKYARELMKLIHKDNACWDIAIWYDEFLTPGENFNDAIKKALKESDLFALAVTPHLLEEKNYILEEEYPMAKAIGKPVFPVELIHTDEAELKEKYQGLPDCVSSRDEDVFFRLLLETLQKVAVTENNKDPQHNFFLGLAYLSGIDVEKDYEKAVALITSAAEAGHFKAMEKLAHMYNTGEGVAFNIEQAFCWKYKAAESVAGTWSSPSTLNYSYPYYLEDLGAFCLTSVLLHEHLKKAKMVYERLREVAENLCQKSPYYMAKVYLAKSYEGLGEVCLRQRDYSAARDYYERNLKLCEENMCKMRPKSGETFENIRYRLALARQKMGLLEQQEGNIGEACNWFLQSYDLLQDLAQCVGAVKVEIKDRRRVEFTFTGQEAWAARALTLCEEKIGDYFLKTNQLRHARERYEQAFRLRESIMKVTDYKGDQYLLAGAFARMGDICRAEGDLAQALAMYFIGITPYLLRNERPIRKQLVIYPVQGAQDTISYLEKAYNQVEQEYLIKLRVRFADMTALPEFMQLIFEDKWGLTYGAPEEEVWHYEILECYFTENDFSSKEEWVSNLMAEYVLLKEKAGNCPRVLTAFQNAIKELQTISLDEINEVKRLIAKD